MKKLFGAIVLVLFAVLPIFGKDMGGERKWSTNIYVKNEANRPICVRIPKTVFYAKNKAEADLVGGYTAYRGYVPLKQKEGVWFTGHARGKLAPKSFKDMFVLVKKDTLLCYHGKPYLLGKGMQPLASPGETVRNYIVGTVGTVMGEVTFNLEVQGKRLLGRYTKGVLKRCLSYRDCPKRCNRIEDPVKRRECLKKCPERGPCGDL